MRKKLFRYTEHFNLIWNLCSPRKRRICPSFISSICAIKSRERTARTNAGPSSSATALNFFLLSRPRRAESHPSPSFFFIAFSHPLLLFLLLKYCRVDPRAHIWGQPRNRGDRGRFNCRGEGTMRLLMENIFLLRKFAAEFFAPS